MMFRQAVDVSDRTTVGVCSCGWRCLHQTRSQAWASLNRHAVEQHGTPSSTSSAASYHRGAGRG